MITSADRTHHRPRRRLRRVGFVTLAALAALGLAGLVIPTSPGVGHFRTPGDRDAYVEAYLAALATLPAPTRTLDLTTRFGTVRAYEWSPPEIAATDPRFTIPVVFMPGRASGAPMWRENLPSLIGHRRLVIFDALGDAGLSAQTVLITSMADQAAWLEESVGQLAEGRVHVVGHSFGGATAMAYARAHPERIASLTLLEPAFTFAYPPASTFFWASVLGLPVPASWRDRATREIAGEDDPIDYSDPVARLIDRAAAGYSADLPVPTPLNAHQLADLRVPVYLALADHKSLAGGERAAERARGLPCATVQIWPNTTHSLPMQVVEPLAEELVTFWAAHDA
ncbi:alpha/beta fold hydrolase [Ammonicoccus fulvus]|uniref:Alpha/beta fold hydrolase n=1 Tax=Ammonicoccus fulvus TaxID=3138240 RepID=A0ABZ3FPF2_9ACTN